MVIFSYEWKNLSTLSFTELPEMSATDSTSHFETLWEISWPLKSPRPAWKGMMQAAQSGANPGVSEIFFMPMIDLNPGDLSCIYSPPFFFCRKSCQEVQRYTSSHIRSTPVSEGFVHRQQ